MVTAIVQTTALGLLKNPFLTNSDCEMSLIMKKLIIFILHKINC